MHEIVGQVLGVQGQHSQNGKLFFSVQFSDGNAYTTFDNALAGKAGQYVNGPQVTARVEMKPKQRGDGFWMNLLDIAPVGQLPPAAVPTVPGTGFPAGMPVTTPQMPPVNGPQGLPAGVTMKPDYTRELSPQAQKRIAWGNAVNAASAIIGGVFSGAGPEGLDEAVEKFKELVTTIYLASSGGEAKATPVTPEAVAAAVPGVEVGAQVPEPAPVAEESDVPSW